MTILSKISPSVNDSTIIGISTSQGCSKDAKFQTLLDDTDKVTEITSFKTTKGDKFTFDSTVPLTIKLSDASDILKSESEITVPFEKSFGNAWDWHSSAERETTTSTGKSLEYNGPGGGLLMAYIKHTKFVNSDIDVEYEIHCNDGSELTEQGKISLEIERYSQPFYVQKHEKFNSVNDCTEESYQCIHSLNGKKGATPNQISKEFHECFVPKRCEAKKMKMLYATNPYLDKAKIVGISTSQGCSKDARFETRLDNTDKVTETTSFVTEKSPNFDFGSSLNIEFQSSTLHFGDGGQINVPFKSSFEKSWDWYSSKTKETTSSAGQSLQYTGPGASMIIAYVHHYKFDYPSVTVEFEVQCENGSSFTERGRAKSLKIERFSKTLLIQKERGFGSINQCNIESHQCLQNVQRKMQSKPTEVNTAFDQCFKKTNHGDDDDDDDVNFYCQARRMKILQKALPYVESVKIVGIASSQGCSRDAIFQTTLEQTNTVTETSAFVTKKNSKFNYGSSLVVELPNSSNRFGDSTEILSVELENNTPNVWNWATAKIKETSISSAQSLKYKGPGAALVMGYVQYYKFDNPNVDVEYYVECNDGSKFTERGTVKLEAERFSQTHFVQKHGVFDYPEDCNEESYECIRAINGNKVLEPAEITKQFENCFNLNPRDGPSYRYSYAAGVHHQKKALIIMVLLIIAVMALIH
ncbi:uncharacterized protein [Clytia hemisphaerica]